MEDYKISKERRIYYETILDKYSGVKIQTKEDEETILNIIQELIQTPSEEIEFEYKMVFLNFLSSGLRLEKFRLV